MELALIDKACDALGMDRAGLISEAALFEATRLGVRYSVEPLPRLTRSWPFLPDRGDEPTGARISTTISRSLNELVKRAAEHVHASEPLFLVGSTLAYIGRLQNSFEGLAEDSPEEAASLRRKLAAIKLPRQYQYRPGV